MAPTGFEMIQASQPDVVLCDIGLPGMSGYELAKQIRERGLNGARLIAISGYAQPEDVRRAIDAGFDAHVAKPPDPGEIHRLLSHEAPAPSSGSART
jgi:CheY-like chemotaxis protein